MEAMKPTTNCELPAGVILAQKKARAYSTRNMTTEGDAADKAAASIEADIGASLRRLLALADDQDEEEEQPKPTRLSKVPPFVLEGVHAQVVEAHTRVMEFIAAVRGERAGVRPHWLALLGKCGCGKTHLLRLTKAALMDAGVYVEMWTWRTVLDYIRSGREDIMRQLKEARVLLVDDVGAEFADTEKALGFSLSKLCELQDSREGKWTVVTSNMLMRHIADADERCASRLLRHGGEVVTLDQAVDWALSKYKEAKKAAKNK